MLTVMTLGVLSHQEGEHVLRLAQAVVFQIILFVLCSAQHREQKVMYSFSPCWSVKLRTVSACFKWTQGVTPPVDPLNWQSCLSKTSTLWSALCWANVSCFAEVVVCYTLHYFLSFVGTSCLPSSSEPSSTIGLYWSISAGVARVGRACVHRVCDNKFVRGEITYSRTER